MGLLFSVQALHGQTSSDVLVEELKELKQQHKDASSETFTAFISQLETAAGSADAAIDLYEKAGGTMPDPAQVETRYEVETPSEKEKRLAKDRAELSSLAYVVQMHCGMMRFAALFIEKPNTPNLHDDWIAWIKTSATLFPQLQEPAANKGPHSVMDMPMRDSIISKYLHYPGWGDKEQGQWKLKDLPKIYREEILEPLRQAHSPDMLASWDVYIAMRQPEVNRDADKWNQVDYPALMFQRGCDDFALAPSTEKLNTLVQLIKDNPTHPDFESMADQVGQMVDAYKKQKGQ